MEHAASLPWIVVIGASARAAARSIRRAGFAVAAIDRFGDRDLQRTASVCLVPAATWPSGVLAALEGWPPGPVCYCGGLENHPDLLEQIAARQPLWGNPADVVRPMRDPFLLAHELAQADIGVPDLRATPSALPLDGTWLEKPRASAGGLGIRPWDEHALERPATAPVIYQRRIAGPALGASFVAGPDNACALLGVCRSWRGGAAGPFAYRASLGPVRLGPTPRAEVERIGAFLTRRFGLRGLFGVDLIRDWTGRLSVLEVNPRMTASMEILERATGQRLFRAHARAFGATARDRDGTRPGFPTDLCRVGKAILYAPADTRVPEVDPPAIRRALRQARRAEARPSLADLPWPGTPIARGEPVCTLFTEAPTYAELRQRLRQQIRIWTHRLAIPAWTRIH